MEQCRQCGRPLPDGAQYCSSCGAAARQGIWETPAGQSVPVTVARSDQGTTAQVEFHDQPLPFAENVAGVIAYITIFPAMVFLLLEPFKRNRFVRFHSFQHLLLWASAVALAIAAALATAILQLIPFMRVLIFPLGGLIALAWFFLWLLLVVKAYYHETFKLPYLGDLAQEWADR